MIEVLNRQRRRKINARQWREFGEQSLEALGKSEQSATIVFVSDEAIKTLNRKFRGKNYATDVLSFPSEAEVFEVDQQKHLVEVVISVQRAAAQARDNDLSFSNALKQRVLQGLCYFAGYDHDTGKD